MKKIFILLTLALIFSPILTIAENNTHSPLRESNPNHQIRMQWRLPQGTINISSISIPIYLREFPSFGRIELAQMGQSRRNKGRIDNANSMIHYTILELNKERYL